MMRSLNRNKRQIHYALRTGYVANLDEYGNETGELTPSYGAATLLSCNISAASGGAEAQVFGSFTGYSRTIYVSGTDCPMDEDSIVWFGTAPPKPHNYIVVRKADSKNGILYALREVTVT